MGSKSLLLLLLLYVGVKEELDEFEEPALEGAMGEKPPRGRLVGGVDGDDALA